MNSHCCKGASGLTATDETGKEKLLTLAEPIQDLSEEHIKKMWQRVEEMIKYGVFISSENKDMVLGSE